MTTPKPENPNRYRALDLSCTEFTQHLNFHLGSAFKYIFLHKEDGGRDDLEKALWHLRRQRKAEPKFKKLKRKRYFKLSQKLESCGFDTGTKQLLAAILYAATEYDEDGIAWAIAYVRTLLNKMPPETEQASHSESPMPSETERGGI
ncbi:putative phage associated protein [Neisseria meningitidis]|uniref:DUF3310 domain-containing protein n=1 Tax=Neisseria meningitidis TaxID=487 RepID=UPI000D9A6F52|nr:DUF3310 domain-containing protein [Neisseria meningitidis]SPY03301.1 putative phage associated protein [Neisseria meningitidis]